MSCVEHARLVALFLTHSGHCDSSFVHHVFLVVMLTELGSMVYCCCPETAEKRRVAEAAKVVAVKPFILAAFFVR